MKKNKFILDPFEKFVFVCVVIGVITWVAAMIYLIKS